MLWSPKCSCQFLWRQIVIVMFTASQIKSSTHVSSSPKSKSVPSLLHAHTEYMCARTHTHTHTMFTAALICSLYRNGWALHPFIPCLSHPHLDLVKVSRPPRKVVGAPKNKRPILSHPAVQEELKMTRQPSMEMQNSVLISFFFTCVVSIQSLFYHYSPCLYLTRMPHCASF